MFETAALPLTSALNPAALPANGIIAENVGSTGEPAETAQTGGFEALLALQSAQAQVTATTNGTIAPLSTKLAALAAAKAATGKDLPDPAMPLAAFAGDGAEIAGETSDKATSEEPIALEFIADPAVIASIFAAPDRLGRLPTDPALSSPSTPAAETVQMPGQLAPEQVATAKAPNAPATQPATAAVVAMAQAAIIELEPPTDPTLPNAPSAVTPASPDVASSLLARPATTSRRMASASEPVADHPIKTPTLAPLDGPASDASLSSIAPDIASPANVRAADAAPSQGAAPASRAEPRAERVDFATLVETLNRAREDASPNTVRVSLAHADFGRVSMRFDRDDAGMSVSMSSADPGFARAVAASNEAASTATSSDTPRGQSQQANSGGSAQGDANRQSQGQRPGTPDRPAAQLRDTLRRKDEPGSSDGIFA